MKTPITQQTHRPYQDVLPYLQPRHATGTTRFDTEGNRETDDEEEGREDEVRQRHAVRLRRIDVLEPRRHVGYTRQVVDEQHQQHDKSTKDVDRQHSIRRVHWIRLPRISRFLSAHLQ
jgi:hypothetical protein